MSSIPFSSFSEFLQMGKYAFHVWTVYGLFSFFILVNLLLPMKQKRDFIKQQQKRLLRDQTLASTRERHLATNNFSDGE